MTNMNPLLLTDFYKTEHHKMYPHGTTMIYSNFTPRKSRLKGVDKVVFFGVQHFIQEYLIKKFNQFFFKSDKTDAISEYKKHIAVDTKHIEALWDLGYLPIEIKSLEEGSLCPIGVPCFTIRNTHPDFGWLTNYLETLISCMMWQPITSATIAYEYKKLLSKYAIETTGTAEFVQWQGHDFSMRGMSSIESAILSGMGHLLSFTGTDTIPAIYQLESSYDATGLIGASVPATEHSVMCMGTKESEVETFKRLLKLYPGVILSVVSDTWDLWKVLTIILPEIKNEVMANTGGKLVIRPDSGDPVDIICGKLYDLNEPKLRELTVEEKGVVQLLWETFGGETNKQGYKVLNPCIGTIYGDSITLERAKTICDRLKAKGFASTNVVLGIGSYTYQYNTRDTFGFAMKATYGEVRVMNKVLGNLSLNTSGIEAREIFKDPITDDGTKKSKKGLLAVYKNDNTGDYYVQDQVSWKEEENSELKTVFLDGKITRKTTLDQIRERLKNQ